MNKLFTICVCIGCTILSSCSIQQPLIKEPLESHEETKEIAQIYTLDDKKVSLGVPTKMFVTVAGIVLDRMAMDKWFFSRTVEIDCPKTIGIKLKDLDKKVILNRFDHNLTCEDSNIPPEVINAPPAKLNREQLLDQRLPKECTKDRIWFPRDDEGKRWVCLDYKGGKLDPLDEIYWAIYSQKPGGDWEWKEIRSSISKIE
jgi:hypothetical protein